MPSLVILLGAPGAGKGTQAVRLSEALSLPHIATGDLFRENMKNDTDLGQRAKSFMDAGKLVPDELVVDMLFDRVGKDDCKGGYLLDGFPRTLPQAEVLSQRVPSDWEVRALNIEVDDESVVERAAGRLLCRTCSNIHHASFAPPETEGVCDADGGELYRRKDDEHEVVRKRIAVYHQQTKPVVDFYSAKELLRSVDGGGSPDEVFQALRQCIEAVA
jgi:adenylate kinase